MRNKRAKDIRREMLQQGFDWKFNRRLYRMAKEAYTRGKM